MNKTSKIILIKQFQTEGEKDDLETSWEEAKTEGMVEVTSREEPNMTWTTTINTVEAVTTKISIESDFDVDDWIKKVILESSGLTKEVLNPDDDYDIVDFIF